MIIALDGPAASGKGTLGRRLAAHFGLAYLDTGALYRGVGVAVLAAGGDPSDPVAAEAAARSLDPASLESPALRTAAAGDAASKVAAIPAVRQALLEFQRAFAARDGGAILDGRDIGTVIVPDADAKLYVSASDEVRADRRFRELQRADPAVKYATVLEDIRARDRRDRERATAPLKPAADAIHLDTSAMTPDEVFDAALAAITTRTGRPA